jgi:hypothetical protein
LAKDGGKFVTSAPNSVFVISKDNNAGLGTNRATSFILLDNKDAHGQNCPRHPFFTYCAILTKGNLFVIVKVLDAVFFLKEALQPNFSVRMSTSLTRVLQHGV